MQGNEVYGVLKQIGAVHLHHANSVNTSCTFLEQGGMLSREFVESHKLLQTAQSSDGVDKTYGIWDRIFLDHVDIHDRGGRARGANYYGPVLFIFDIEILHGLPEGTEILVAKSDQLGNLFHELKHAAGYSSQVDAPPGLTGAQVDQFWANEYQTNAQNCSAQQVQMQTSDVGGTIQ
jgi:hypothetical protein